MFSYFVIMCNIISYVGVSVENTISSSLFKNCLGLLADDGSIELEEVSALLDISRGELVKVFDLSEGGVEADDNIEQLEELVVALDFIAESFEGDLVKTELWMNSSNRNFGGVSPRDLILKGKMKKVTKFVFALRAGY